ncbi:MAG: cupredoxin domain-containing protein [Candidatus Omnitrophota bacterium]
MRKLQVLLCLFGLILAVSCAADQGNSSGEGPGLSGRIENGVRIIAVKASSYKFEPDPIVVKLGEKVRLVVTSTDVAHGLAIAEFKLRISIPAGKTETVEFIADKKGTFQMRCSVYCGPGHGQMRGELIVR